MNRLQLYAARGRFVIVSDRNGSVGRRLEEEVEEDGGRQIEHQWKQDQDEPAKINMTRLNYFGGRTVNYLHVADIWREDQRGTRINP
jgi:hypothetical protein